MNKNGKIISVAIFALMAVVLVGLAVAPPPKDSCSDTDGGNVIAVFGTVSGYANKVAYSNSDTCVNTGTVLEYYCSGVYKTSSQQSCGTDVWVGSNYCSNDDVYRNYTDYACASGACSSTTAPRLVQDCNGGYCSSGACVFNNTCTDTDGGITAGVVGTVSGTYNGNPFSNTDFCFDSTHLMENYCAGTAAAYTNVTCSGSYTQCVSGQCI